jgi:hypothetical protein
MNRSAIEVVIPEGPKDRSRNLEIPGSRGACHRAAQSADPLARPGMTVQTHAVAARSKRSAAARASAVISAPASMRAISSRR